MTDHNGDRPKPARRLSRSLIARWVKRRTGRLAPARLLEHDQRGQALWDGMSFQQFIAALAACGFQPVATAGEHKAFNEPGSGAMVVLPGYGENDPVSPLHIRAVSKLLREKGLV